MKFQQDQKIYDKYNSISIKNWSCIMTLSINILQDSLRFQIN